MGGVSMRLGAAQMFIADNLEDNLASIARLVTDAARRGVELLVFPEMSLTGYNPRTLGQPGFSRELTRGLERLAQQATTLQIGIIVGRADFADGKLYNAASVLLPGGTVHTYHKINLTAIETKYFTPGVHPLVFAYRGRKFGVIICRDQNYPELARSIKTAGTEALFILAAHYYHPREARWKVEKNQALPIARAVENNFHVLLANAVGSHLGLVSLGHSLIADPEGALVALADETTETILTCDLNPQLDL